MTTRSAPDPFWLRAGQCVVVAATFASHFLSDVIEDVLQSIAVRARAKRHRVFRVTRPH